MSQNAAQPLVSVLITNYNYGQYLSQAIDSSLAQTYPRIEIVVVDDGSTDHSHDVMRAYGDRIIPVLTPNGGQAAALGAGFCASRGDIVCLLDSDDVFFPEKVQAVADIFRAEPDVDWCFHALEYVNADLSQRLRIAPESTAGRRDFRKSVLKGRLRFSHPATSGLCFRRSLFAMAMPLPYVRGSFQQVDNFLKFVASGLRAGYFMDAPLGQLRVHGNNMYSDMPDRPKKHAMASVEIAATMHDRWPQFYRFTDRIMAHVLELTWHSEFLPPREVQLLRDYIATLSMTRLAYVYGRASVRYARQFARTRVMRTVTGNP
jgi:glycosyltransferase involved in cell wall biosynthesis